jgi:itaconate CoA-transferase
VQSEVGLIAITGTERQPVKVGISVADIAAGMYAYSGVLTALITRATTGHGASVEVSLFDALGEWMQHAAYYTGYGGAPPARSGPNHASIAPYGPFQTGDGDQVYLGVQNAREWTRFCSDVLQQPDLLADDRFATNSARVRNRDALQHAIDLVFATLPTRAVVERLDVAAIAHARMNSVAEFVDHPQLAARECWRDIGSPAGALRALVPPVRMSGVEPVMGDVPALGQHTDAILGELGVDRDTIARWRKEGLV